MKEKDFIWYKKSFEDEIKKLKKKIRELKKDVKRRDDILKDTYKAIQKCEGSVYVLNFMDEGGDFIKEDIEMLYEIGEYAEEEDDE